MDVEFEEAHRQYKINDKRDEEYKVQFYEVENECDDIYDKLEKLDAALVATRQEVTDETDVKVTRLQNNLDGIEKHLSL